MVNYYSQIGKLKDFIKQQGYKIESCSNDDLKKCMMLFYGFSDKGVNKWIENFISAGLIKEFKNDDGVLVVELL